MLNIGFKVSMLDFSLFAHEENGILICHVDDLMYAGNAHFCDVIIPKIFETFEIGKIEQNRFDYCGSTIRLVEDMRPPRFSISQSHYATKIVIPVVPFGSNDDSPLRTEDYQVYRTVLGQLSWICISTRPDLSYITNFLSQNQNAPNVQHLKMLKRAAKQAKANSTRTLDFIGLKGTPLILGFSDANLNKSNDETHISQTGICIFIAFFAGETLYGNLLDWSSTKQKRVSRSTLASETLALTELIDRCEFLKKLYEAIFGCIDITTHLFCDNKSLVTTARTTTTVREKGLILDIASIREKMQLPIFLIWSKSTFNEATVLFVAAFRVSLKKKETDRSFIRNLNQSLR